MRKQGLCKCTVGALGRLAWRCFLYHSFGLNIFRLDFFWISFFDYLFDRFFCFFFDYLFSWFGDIVLIIAFKSKGFFTRIQYFFLWTLGDRLLLFFYDGFGRCDYGLGWWCDRLGCRRWRDKVLEVEAYLLFLTLWRREFELLIKADKEE